MKQPRTAKENLYAQHQSEARKAVERAFGVLFSRFKILEVPARLWELEELDYIMRTCCIMHNMIGEHREIRYTGTLVTLGESEELLQNTAVSYVALTRPESTYDQARFWREHCDPIEDPEQFHRLQVALQNHIWNMKGDDESALE